MQWGVHSIVERLRMEVMLLGGSVIQKLVGLPIVGLCTLIFSRYVMVPLEPGPTLQLYFYW